MAPSIKSMRDPNESAGSNQPAGALDPHPGDEALLHVKKQWADSLEQYLQRKGHTAVLQNAFPPSVISYGPRVLLKTPLEVCGQRRRVPNRS